MRRNLVQSDFMPFGEDPYADGVHRTVVTYMGNGRQGVSPVTGQTIPNSDPLRHIPLGP
ncbi:MAG: hypothetical protein JSS77_04630 [Acidobacteria bacterium]|nr:hypothetical protein [Acidobacteriota bacterium]